MQSSKKQLLSYISTSYMKNESFKIELLPNGTLPIIPRHFMLNDQSFFIDSQCYESGSPEYIILVDLVVLGNDS